MIKEKMKHNEEILVAGGFLALYVWGGGRMVRTPYALFKFLRSSVGVIQRIQVLGM